MKNLLPTISYLALTLSLSWYPAPTAKAFPFPQETDESVAAAAAKTAEQSSVPQTVITRILANGIEVRKQSIPGVAHATIIIEFKTGDNQDPQDAPGLSQLLIDLAATASLEDDPEPAVLSLRRLSQKYPAGWIAQSHPDHTILAYVIPAEDLSTQIALAANRIQKINLNKEAIDHSLDRLFADLKRRFNTETQLIPTSWVTAKAFRHSSGALHGFSPEALAKLPASRLRAEWQIRTHPRNIRLYLTGNLGEDESAINTVIEQSFGSITPRTEHAPDLRTTVRPAQGKERRRRIQVSKLPTSKEHVVCAYYAPDITHPDHPAFLTITTKFMNAARRLPGSQSRVAFQYSMLLDPRAAYLTPHHWRFPKGAGQALGYWSVKMKNERFSNTDGRATLRQLAWQLGENLSPAIIDEMNRNPAILFTIAYATANRARYGDSFFWDDYRDRLAHLRKADLTTARDKYLLANPNIAVFVLSAPSK